MPVLKNPRHEAFAQAIFRGICREPGQPYPSHGNSYSRAGYTANGIGKAGGAAETNASRLLKNALVFDRVAELQREAAKDSRETVQKVVRELNEIKEASMADADKPAFSAAVSAVMGKAKVLGLITEQHRNVGDGIDYAKAASLHDIGRMMLMSVGYGSPSAHDIDCALAAHAELTAKLEAIAERAGAGESEH